MRQPAPFCWHNFVPYLILQLGGEADHGDDDGYFFEYDDWWMMDQFDIVWHIFQVILTKCFVFNKTLWLFMTICFNLQLCSGGDIRINLTFLFLWMVFLSFWNPFCFKLKSVSSNLQWHWEGEILNDLYFS